MCHGQSSIRRTKKKESRVKNRRKKIFLFLQHIEINIIMKNKKFNTAYLRSRKKIITAATIEFRSCFVNKYPTVKNHKFFLIFLI